MKRLALAAACVAPVVGGYAYTHNPAGGSNESPAWSPDGTKIDGQIIEGVRIHNPLSDA